GAGEDRHLATTIALGEAYLALELGEPARALAVAGDLEEERGALLHRRLGVLGIVHAAAGDADRASAVAARLAELAGPEDVYAGGLVARIQAVIAEHGGSADGDHRERARTKFADAADALAAGAAGVEA